MSLRYTVMKKAGRVRGLTFFQALLALFVLLAAGTTWQADAAKGKKCENMDGGDWKFGEAPSGCNASRYGDVTRVNTVYAELLFDRRDSDSLQRSRYVTNLHALIRDLASDYIKRREPQFTDAQVGAWVHAIMSIANQESYLSHYRIGLDGKLKLMTGDRHISHGIMQINQKYHAGRGRDSSFDLAGNVLYGMDLFYLELKRAERARCVRALAKGSAEKLWQAKIRAAYSSYNGGPGAVCRWTKPRHKWAKNDKGFHQKVRDAEWRRFVTDFAAPSPVDAACLAAGDDLCAASEVATGKDLAGRPLLIEDGRTCFLDDKRTLLCAADPRTFQCLEQLRLGSPQVKPLRLKTHGTDFRLRTVADRDSLCRKLVPGLAAVGGFVRVIHDSFISDGIDGNVVGSVKAGTALQVLDYEISRDAKGTRHYRVRLDQKRDGYIHGGDAADKRVEPIDTDPNDADLNDADLNDADLNIVRWIPTAGSRVKIKRDGGVRLLERPHEEAGTLAKIPARVELDVESVLSREGTNEIYVAVRFRGQEGYVYAGRVYPEITVQEWVEVLK